MKIIKEVLWSLFIGACFSTGFHLADWLITSEYMPLYLAVFGAVMLPVTYHVDRKFRKWITSSEGK